MSKLNFSRQLKDIQIQAENISKGKPSVSDIENFTKYSDELKAMLSENVDIDFVQNLITEIPSIQRSETHIKKGIFASLFGVLGFMGQEDRFIQEAKSTIETIRGKYASIEFVVKNNE